MTIPAWHFNSLIAKESSGVGLNELKINTLIPLNYFVDYFVKRKC